MLQKIERLKASLHLLDAEDKPKNKHIIFVDSKKEGWYYCNNGNISDFSHQG